MKDLSIPEKISLDKMVSKNLRQKDLPKLGMLAAPGTIIGIIVWILSTDRPLIQLIAMASIFGYLFLCYILVSRVDGSQSILDYIASLIRFQREQQCLYYKQGKEKIYHVAADRSEEADGTGIH